MICENEYRMYYPQGIPSTNSPPLERAGLLSSVKLRLLRYARNDVGGLLAGDGCDAEVLSLRGS
jgi:hypothetical protein